MFNVTIEFGDITELGKEAAENVKQIAKRAQEELGMQAHAKGLQFAQERLHSRLKFFQDFWKMDPKDDAFYLVLQKEAVWIDEGLPVDYLRDALLNGPNAKKPGQLAIVPFKTPVGSGPTNTTAYNLEIADAVKKEFSKRKIPWAKIQKDDQGRPLLGRIAKLNGLNTPLKTHEGAGMGQGAIGQPRQGHTGIAYLQGASLYQFEKVNRNTPSVRPGFSSGVHGEEGSQVERGVITFRTVSANHPDKFHHPGLEATNIVESTWDWALEELEKNILPKLFNQIM